MSLFRKKSAKKTSGQLTELGVKNARAQLRLIRGLKSVREQHGISVQDVADSMGVDVSMVYRFEKGGTNFTMSTLRAYADAVNAKLELVAIPARESLELSNEVLPVKLGLTWSYQVHLEAESNVREGWNPPTASSTDVFKASL